MDHKDQGAVAGERSCTEWTLIRPKACEDKPHIHVEPWLCLYVMTDHALRTYVVRVRFLSPLSTGPAFVSHAGSELRRGRDAVRVLKCMRGNGGTTTLRFN